MRKNCHPQLAPDSGWKVAGLETEERAAGLTCHLAPMVTTTGILTLYLLYIVCVF